MLCYPQWVNKRNFIVVFFCGIFPKTNPIWITLPQYLSFLIFYKILLNTVLLFIACASKNVTLEKNSFDCCDSDSSIFQNNHVAFNISADILLCFVSNTIQYFHFSKCVSLVKGRIKLLKSTYNCSALLCYMLSYLKRNKIKQIYIFQSCIKCFKVFHVNTVF